MFIEREHCLPDKKRKIANLNIDCSDNKKILLQQLCPK